MVSFRTAMKRSIEFVKENFRFILAIFVNLIALIVSLVWMIDANFSANDSIEMEPIVTFFALLATLLGLNFVNDKLTKPRIKVSLSISVAHDNYGNTIPGINVRLENHSMLKVFIRNFKVRLSENDGYIQFLHEGFTNKPLPKVILEPGEAFDFNLVIQNFQELKFDSKLYGDFIVNTETGDQFIVPKKVFREHLDTLFRIKKHI